MSDWSWPPVSTINHQSPHTKQLSQVQITNEHKPTVPSIEEKDRLGWTPLVLGLAMGVLTAATILSIVLVLWLKLPSNITTSVQTSTATETTTTTSSPAIIYNQSFVAGSISVASSQCTAWLTFQSQLVSRPYTSMTMEGTNDATGITLTNSTHVLGIATALRTNTTYGPVSSNGYSWVVGLCGVHYELTATGAICSCNTGYTVRPCIGNLNWGAINASTCSASTQTMTVIFQ